MATAGACPPLTGAALFEPVDSGDMRVVQRREELCLPFEAREAIDVAGERLGQDLDRDIALELRVASAIHLPHATRTDVRNDFVGADAVAGREGQGRVEYTRGHHSRSPRTRARELSGTGSRVTVQERQRLLIERLDILVQRRVGTPLEDQHFRVGNRTCQSWNEAGRRQEIEATERHQCRRKAGRALQPSGRAWT
jgi:hypothetical protein